MGPSASCFGGISPACPSSWQLGYGGTAHRQSCWGNVTNPHSLPAVREGPSMAWGHLHTASTNVHRGSGWVLQSPGRMLSREGPTV